MGLFRAGLTGLLSLGLILPATTAAHAAVSPVSGPVSGGTPVTIDVPVERFKAIEAGRFGNLGINAEGTLMGWGGTHFRTAGDMNGIASPSAVPGLPAGELRDFGLNVSTSWAIDGAGKLWLWGTIPVVSTPQTAPVSAPIDDSVELTAASASNTHALAVDASGAVWGWGNNWQGELGTGVAGPQEASPVLATAVNQALSGLGRRAVDVTVGVNSSFVTDNAGGLWSFGMNKSGMLGQGASTPGSPIPKRLEAIVGSVQSVQVSGYTTFALTDAGQLYSWGARSTGILGDEGVGDVTAPRPVAALQGSRITDFSVSMYALPHVLALTDTGETWSWGSNGGSQLGRATPGAADAIPAPVTALGSLPVTEVAAGAEYSVTLLADGTLRAWGVDHNGSLGRGIYTPSAEPVASGLSAYARTSFGEAQGAWVELNGVPQITVATPPHPSGSVDVRVATTSPIGKGRWEPGPVAEHPAGFEYQATLTFDPQNGTPVQRVTVADGPIAVPTAPSRAGYTFRGWSSEPEGGVEGLPAVPMAADATVYAQWEPANAMPLVVQTSGTDLGRVEVGAVGRGTVVVSNQGSEKVWVRPAHLESARSSGIALGGGDSPFAVEPGASQPVPLSWAPSEPGKIDVALEFNVAATVAGLSGPGVRVVNAAVRGEAISTEHENSQGAGTRGGRDEALAASGASGAVGIAGAAALAALITGVVLLVRRAAARR